MTIKSFKAVLCLVFALSASQVHSQTNNVSGSALKPALWDGVIVAGYVDNGAYLNFSGPNIKYTRKPVVLALGMLPGLRIKEDKVAEGSPANSTITPSLGLGLTASYKHLAVQIPVYYTNKTAAKDGKWHPGFGLGYKF